MKPLLIFKFDSWDYEPNRAREFDEYIQKTSLPNDYDILVMWGGDSKVYYPFNFISFHYNKLKAWLIRKIWKRNTYLNTSETR